MECSESSQGPHDCRQAVYVCMHTPTPHTHEKTNQVMKLIGILVIPEDKMKNLVKQV